MGCKASKGTAVLPHLTVEAALADVKSQDEIDASLTVAPAKAAAAATAPEEKQQERKDAKAAAAEATALPNNGQPPDPVMVFIEGRGDALTRLDNEKEKKIFFKKSMYFH